MSKVYSSVRHRSVLTVSEENDRWKFLTKSHHNLRYTLTKSLKEELFDSLIPLIFGLTLITAGVAVFMWNEAKAVEFSRMLGEGVNSVVQISPNDPTDPNNEGKLIMISGSLSIGVPLEDEDYGVMSKSVALKRRVQMYQWVEEFTFLEELASPEEPFYVQIWKDRLVDSDSFSEPRDHKNPKSLPVTSVIQTADSVRVGPLQLSAVAKASFTQFFSIAGDEPPDSDDLKLHNGMYYNASDIFDPEVGETRVQFYYAGMDGEIVTIVGRQVGREIHSHVTSFGKEIMMVKSGKLSLLEMFSMEQEFNSLECWIRRFLSWLMIFVGIGAISFVSKYVASFPEELNEALELGMSPSPFILSVVFSLLLISGAWCFHRPDVSFVLFLTAAIPLCFTLSYWRNAHKIISRVTRTSNRYNNVPTKGV